jgi:hypothetical protein
MSRESRAFLYNELTAARARANELEQTIERIDKALKTKDAEDAEEAAKARLWHLQGSLLESIIRANKDEAPAEYKCNYTLKEVQPLHDYSNRSLLVERLEGNKSERVSDDYISLCMGGHCATYAKVCNAVVMATAWVNYKRVVSIETASRKRQRIAAATAVAA